jgi:hypothetical protein
MSGYVFATERLITTWRTGTYQVDVRSSPTKEIRVYLQSQSGKQMEIASTNIKDNFYLIPRDKFDNVGSALKEGFYPKITRFCDGTFRVDFMTRGLGGGGACCKQCEEEIVGAKQPLLRPNQNAASRRPVAGAKQPLSRSNQNAAPRKPVAGANISSAQADSSFSRHIAKIEAQTPRVYPPGAPTRRAFQLGEEIASQGEIKYFQLSSDMITGMCSVVFKSGRKIVLMLNSDGSLIKTGPNPGSYFHIKDDE